MVATGAAEPVTVFAAAAGCASRPASRKEETQLVSTRIGLAPGTGRYDNSPPITGAVKRTTLARRSNALRSRPPFSGSSAMSDPYNSAPPPIPASTPQLTDAMVTTAQELPGYRIVANLGVVRGIIVRSRSVVGNCVGGIQSLFGGNITIYTSLCEQARMDTYRDMVVHARQKQANAIIAMRYDATELMAGPTAVLCYGTAVQVVPANRD